MSPAPAAAASGPVRRRRQSAEGVPPRSLLAEAWIRDDGILGPPVRRRIGRAVSRTLPGAIALLGAAGVVRGGFARPGTGVQEWTVLALLGGATAVAVARAVRRSG
ncbi:MAG TPA: hypothetical protein VFM45_06865, partial [Anaeromyxobacteraceae bacterium]|nr:hypothetical protein [Anaeromyxobacteraceae bacterium]